MHRLVLLRLGEHMPVVSVIIPTYNRAHLVGQTIESALAQTFQDIEVLVIDDGSTDRTRDTVEGYAAKSGGRLTYIYQENQGLAGARNTGCRLAKGKYLGFLDSDDLWKPEKLAVQMPELEKDPQVGLVSSMAEVINADATQVIGLKPGRPPGITLREMITEGTHPPSTFLVRRIASESIGHFDAAIRSGIEDVDYCFRLSRKWKFVCLKDVLIQYRYHESNLSSEPVGTYTGYIQTYGKLLSDPSPEVPLPVAKRYLAKYHYLLGRSYARQKKASEALREFVAALRVWPMVGLVVLEGTQAWWRKAIGLIKPFCIVFGLSFVVLFSGKRS